MNRRYGIAAVALTAILVAGGLAWSVEPHAGQIMSVESQAILVLDMIDGEMERFLVSETTLIIRDGQTAKLGDLQAGDRVIIDAQQLNGKLMAKTIEARTMG